MRRNARTRADCAFLFIGLVVLSLFFAGIGNVYAICSTAILASALGLRFALKAISFRAMSEEAIAEVMEARSSCEESIAANRKVARWYEAAKKNLARYRQEQANRTKPAPVATEDRPDRPELLN